MKPRPASRQEPAYDVETAFQNRLALTPLRQAASLVGPLSGAVAVAMVGSGVYVVAALVVGMQFEGSWRGCCSATAPRERSTAAGTDAPR